MSCRSIIEKHKKESIELLKKELNGDFSIPSIRDYLDKRSHIGIPGMYGPDSRVNKEALRLASVYLQDLVDILGLTYHNFIKIVSKKSNYYNRIGIYISECKGNYGGEYVRVLVFSEDNDDAKYINLRRDSIVPYEL